MPKLFTIGHGTRTVDEVVEALHSVGVIMVADVRAYPHSRTNPHFNMESLAERLPALGIGYAHLPALGGRRRGLGAASPNVAWRHAGFRGYADYMLQPAFWEALDGFLEQARSMATAVMCSETLWWRCHRRLIADAATARGVDVWHIMRPGVVQHHALSVPAIVVGDRVTYSR